MITKISSCSSTGISGNPGYAYLYFAGQSGTLIDNHTYQIIPADGTFSNLRVDVQSPPGGGTITFTLYVNGSDTVLSATMGASSTSTSDTTHLVYVKAGDLVCLKITTAGGPTIVRTGWSLEFTPRYRNQNILMTNVQPLGGGFKIHPLGTAGSVSTSDIALIMPQSGKIKNLYAASIKDTGEFGGKNFYVRKNGTLTSMTVSLPIGTYSGSDTVDEITVAVGDRIEFYTDGGSANRYYLSVGAVFEPDVENNSVWGAITNGPSSTATTYQGATCALFSSAVATWNIYATRCTRCTVKNLYVLLNNAPGTGNSRTFTLIKNGSATPLTVTISDGNTFGSITTDVELYDFDYISMEHVPTSNPTTTGNAMWGMEVYYENPAKPNTIGAIIQ